MLQQYPLRNCSIWLGKGNFKVKKIFFSYVSNFFVSPLSRLGPVTFIISLLMFPGDKILVQGSVFCWMGKCLKTFPDLQKCLLKSASMWDQILIQNKPTTTTKNHMGEFGGKKMQRAIACSCGQQRRWK